MALAAVVLRAARPAAPVAETRTAPPLSAQPKASLACRMSGAEQRRASAWIAQALPAIAGRRARESGSAAILRRNTLRRSGSARLGKPSLEMFCTRAAMSPLRQARADTATSTHLSRGKWSAIAAVHGGIRSPLRCVGINAESFDLKNPFAFLRKCVNI